MGGIPKGTWLRYNGFVGRFGGYDGRVIKDDEQGIAYGFLTTLSAQSLRFPVYKALLANDPGQQVSFGDRVRVWRFAVHDYFPVGSHNYDGMAIPNFQAVKDDTQFGLIHSTEVQKKYIAKVDNINLPKEYLVIGKRRLTAGQTVPDYGDEYPRNMFIHEGWREGLVISSKYGEQRLVMPEDIIEVSSRYPIR